MTTSRETNDLNHPVLRSLVDAANAMPVADRVTLLKALVPGVALEVAPRDFEGLIVECVFRPMSMARFGRKRWPISDEVDGPFRTKAMVRFG